MNEADIKVGIASAIRYFGVHWYSFTMNQLVIRVHIDFPSIDNDDIVRLAPELLDKSEYKFEPTERGGQVFYDVITSDDDFKGWKY